MENRIEKIEKLKDERAMNELLLEARKTLGVICHFDSHQEWLDITRELHKLQREERDNKQREDDDDQWWRKPRE